MTTFPLVTPPLKWAGGKRWLVQRNSNIFPNIYGKYYEPFAGSAAVFFHLAPNRAVLSDLNQDLIDTYRALRDYSDEVNRLLAKHQQKHSHDHYYTTRATKPRSITAKAARFIYLNRTCFNGLYRVNQKGDFNVPKGTKNSVILDTDNFEEVANRLSNAVLLYSDFESIIDLAHEGDLIFADPPYTVMHTSNGFLKYNEILFSWKDQLRLAASLDRARQRNAIIVATNADHPSVASLYKEHFVVNQLLRNSLISSKSTYRGKVGELLITSK
jgi:DNA adenine methylase